jgi:hypothetical protein
MQEQVNQVSQESGLFIKDSELQRLDSILGEFPHKLVVPLIGFFSSVRKARQMEELQLKQQEEASKQKEQDKGQTTTLSVVKDESKETKEELELNSTEIEKQD